MTSLCIDKSPEKTPLHVEMKNGFAAILENPGYPGSSNCLEGIHTCYSV